MPKKYKEYHQQKYDIERREQMASAYTVIEIVKICAEDSTNFKEFTELLKDALIKLEKRMDE